MPIEPLAVPIDSELDSELGELVELDVVGYDDDDDAEAAAGAAAAVLVDELLELPHPATAMADTASAASTAARNFAVARMAMMFLPE